MWATGTDDVLLVAAVGAWKPCGGWRSDMCFPWRDGVVWLLGQRDDDVIGTGCSCSGLEAYVRRPRELSSNVIGVSLNSTIKSRRYPGGPRAPPETS